MKCLFLYSNNPLFYFFCESPLFVSYLYAWDWLCWLIYKICHFFITFSIKERLENFLKFGIFPLLKFDLLSNKALCGVQQKSIDLLCARMLITKNYYFFLNECEKKKFYSKFRLFEFFVNFWMKCNYLWLKSYLAKSLGWCCGEFNSKNCWKTQ